VATTAREFSYTISLDASGRVTAPDAAPLDLEETWTPEHLVLAGLARCTIESLRYHVRRAGGELSATARAAGRVTRREEDGRYAFVALEADLDVEIDPPPEDDAVRELMEKAEWDCFVGASLRPSPVYRWRVNGREVASSG
jgi:organic hydroperoxide reductase OsmC/OhrA